ncbi:MAG: tetratricopeptide repeat protein [Acidobacteria bacterium]|nr:tetratricopeptide repeat protein [Acidobacteriota bacterium]
MRFLALLAICAGLVRAETDLVVPFFNHSKNTNVDWIGESIAESVGDTLASQGLLVLGRDERLEAYRRLSLRPGAELTHASILKIGVTLDAAKVVYGYYELVPPASGTTQTKGSLRIVARVIDVKQSRQGGEFSEIGAVEDLGTLQNHLGWQVLAALSPRTAPGESAFMSARPAVRLDAVESYVRGLLAATPEQRHRYFTQAARLDEHYSQPCFQLGKSAWDQKDYRVAAGWLDRVALTDPHYLEAQFFFALCKYLTGDFAAAEKSFQTVADSIPLNEAFNDLGVAQAQRGDFTAAAVSFRKALEGDDADPDYHFNLGTALWRGGRYNEAAESFRDVLARKSDDQEATVMLGRALKQQAPRPGETRQDGKLRLKTNYEESAYRQLQAEIGAKK